MLKIFIFLLFAMLIQAHCPGQSSCQGSCPCRESSTNTNWINMWIKERVKSAVSSALANVKFTCTSVKSTGRLSTCPSGYKAVSCSCGFACGSWDIQGDTTCHCQCLIMDWATAQCCRIRK